MRILAITALSAILVAGCAASGYQQFYKAYGDPKAIPDVQLLATGEKPTIYSSDDLDRDIKILLSKGFTPIGQSAFNGALEGEQQVIAQASRVGARVVLVKSAYTNTQTNTVPLFLPNNSTTYSSGTAYGTGGSASYYGSSTTYGNTVVPITSQQRRYDQTAVYFVKVNKKYKFGVQLADLTPEQRVAIERNTGAVINVVLENSPALVANILPGDILIRLNGVDVRNTAHALELMAAAPSNADVELDVLRNGQMRAIHVHTDQG